MDHTLQEEIYSSSYAAAAYLESIKFPDDKKVSSLPYATLFASSDVHCCMPCRMRLHQHLESTLDLPKMLRCLVVIKPEPATMQLKLHSCGTKLERAVQGIGPSPAHDCAVTPAGPQVYVVGDVGIEEELDLKGINHIGGPADKDQTVELRPGYAMPHDHDVSSPVVSTSSPEVFFERRVLHDSCSASPHMHLIAVFCKTAVCLFPVPGRLG